MFVKCIYSEQAEPYLKEGTVYKVLDEREDSYMVDANTNYWNKGRFEVVEESVYAYLILSDYDCEVWINKLWFEENI